MKNLIIVFVALLLVSCGVTKLPKGTTAVNQKTAAGYIPNRTLKDGSSYGTVFFDATKRSAVTTVYRKNMNVKFLSEEQPDVAVIFVEKIVASLEGEYKEDIKSVATFTKDIIANLKELSNKSNSLNYMRTALYRLNEAYYNGDVDSTFLSLYSEVIDNAKEIQLQELKKDDSDQQSQTLVISESLN